MMTPRWRLATALLPCLLIGCATAPTPDPGPVANVASLYSDLDRDFPVLPRGIVLEQAARQQMRLSPDGQHISFLAQDLGALQLWVAPTHAPEQARPITQSPYGLRAYTWTYRNTLLYLHSPQGDGQLRLIQVEPEGAQPRDMSPQAPARFLQLSHLLPHQALISQQAPGQRQTLCLLDLGTAQCPALLDLPADHGVLADAQLQPRLLAIPQPQGGLALQRPPSKNSAPTPWKSWDHAQMQSTQLLGLDGQGEWLRLLSRGEADTTALREIHLETGQVRVLAQQEGADLDSALFHPADRRLLGWSWHRQQRHWSWLDPALAQEHQQLAQELEGQPYLISRSLDHKKWLLSLVRGDKPPQIYLYDRNKKKATALWSQHPALEEAALAPLRSGQLRARDGQTLDYYLTLPPWVPAQSQRPTRPLPLVLWVQGDPWTPMRWGMDPHHQWLANRGFAVLTVNHRGVQGRGRAFARAGDQQWGQDMHHDLLDAVAHMVKEEIARPDKIAIAGISYGGYATALALGKAPQTFACGVALSAPLQLETLMKALPRQWTALVESMAARIGDHRTPEGLALLQRHSPAAWLHQASAPLLLIHGDQDARAPVDQTRALLTDPQIRAPVTWLLFQGEPHLLEHRANRLTAYAAAEAFLHQHLGGRLQDLEDDLWGASFTPELGLEHLPALRRAMQAQGEPSVK